MKPFLLIDKTLYAYYDNTEFCNTRRSFHMAVVTSTIKGQIVIPAPLRKKFQIVNGTRVQVYDDGKHIIVDPIFDDPIATGKGMLKTKGRALKALISDRKKESKQ
jgi:AbrB family looped-hinge helix DNA binding protein